MKIHYPAPDGDKTLCGRDVNGTPGRLVNGTLQVTNDPHRVTCLSCKTSPMLDGALGSMTHTGH